MTENGLFVLGGTETQLHDIFGPSMKEKPVVEAMGRKILGSYRLWWEVGGKRCAFLSYTCEALTLTEPEQGIGL